MLEKLTDLLFLIPDERRAFFSAEAYVDVRAIGADEEIAELLENSHLLVPYRTNSSKIQDESLAVTAVLTGVTFTDLKPGIPVSLS